MMFTIKPQPTQFSRLIRWGRYLFLFLGVSALSYCALVLGGTWGFQTYQARRFDRAMKDSPSYARSQTQSASLIFPPGKVARDAFADGLAIKIVEGSPLGRIEIPSVGIAAMVMEGTSGKTLRLAVGHIPGTAIPGHQGNVALAAHRDTFFRALRNIHKDDEIILTTLEGPTRYLVDTTQVVGPDDIAALAATTDNFLTLVSCYPFYFVGPAPKRFIVRAHRISE